MPNVYMFNTNKSNNPTDEAHMLDAQKCAAYYSPWKYYIDNLEANDLVFLYSNDTGIIARGIASGIVEIQDYEGRANEEHYMYLNRFKRLEMPLSAADITNLISAEVDESYTIRWNQTMILLPYALGLKVWQHITRKCL